MTERALAVFRRLADVESALHRVPVDRVHFHEVGGHDAIIDIVGTVVALEVLAIDEVTASPVATGTGMVRSAHGPLPNPSPAAVRLLEGVPTYGRATTVELTTPTGAALLAALSTSFGPMPAMVIHHSGFGAGRTRWKSCPTAPMSSSDSTTTGRPSVRDNQHWSSRRTSTMSPGSNWGMP